MTYSMKHAIFLFFALTIPRVVVGMAADIDSAPTGTELERQFQTVMAPFLKTYCLECHAKEQPEAMLNLAGYTSVTAVAQDHQVWEIILERLEAKEMPPEEASTQPESALRTDVVEWIRAVREFEATRRAGDPGPVPARRLSNAEYDHSIRDLTGVDIRPTKTFPVDPANEAGFDNSGESLVMSPALLKKYLDAARTVVDYLVLKPDGIAFAPHPVVTDTDRDKYCVKRIVQFYYRQPTDFADYFLAAWQFRHRKAHGHAAMTLDDIAAASRVSPKYLATIWSVLNDDAASVGPIAEVQTRWRKLPSDAASETEVRDGCEQLRDFVVALRKKLIPKFESLHVDGIHKGSQTFVLWRNRQYADHRRSLNRNALIEHPAQVDEDATESPAEEDGTVDRDLLIPADPELRAPYEQSFQHFCDVFPDAFYISERGRDYVEESSKQQGEKGRLLSAGFHSMMGYFRDDGPLYDLILDADQQQTIDALWRELDFVTSAPMRQYVGFLWFERTDSRYMRDPQFDFARAEDRDAQSEKMIQKLADVYLQKARESGGRDDALGAIEDYFHRINDQIRWVENARMAAEPRHLQATLNFASRAFRRPLSATERDELLQFYQTLRDVDRLSHEEAIQDTIVSILMSPHFCYRLGLSGSGEGTRRLTGFELASRLSYFLWASMPDNQLLQKAAADLVPDTTADSTDVLVQETRRMLQDSRVRGLATEFAGNWLDFRRFQEHKAVDRERFPEFTDDLRSAMFEEPIRFFVDLVRRDGSVLELLDADHTFVNDVLAKHYGLSDEFRNRAGPSQVDSGQWKRIDSVNRFGRGGLIPMSVFLTANSPGLRTSPVKRGYWVVRRLLGERIPPPPPNVPDLPDDESRLGELTLRETLARHRDHKSCAGCHNRFDSIGLVFEGFGPIGERRERDLGDRPISTSAVFPGGQEGHGVNDLRKYLLEHRREEFLDNFCRQLLSYALSRSLVLSDDLLIREMRHRLAADGYRFGSLIETIVTSSQFLNRRADTESGVNQTRSKTRRVE